MGKYFISIEFYDESQDRFLSCVVEADLDEISLPKLAINCLEEHGFSTEGYTINVKAFNKL